MFCFFSLLPVAACLLLFILKYFYIRFLTFCHLFFPKTLPSFIFYFFNVTCLDLIFGSSFSKNLSGGAHLPTCKKPFRVSSALLTDLSCQIYWCLYITKLCCQHLCCQMFSLVTPGSSVTQTPFTLTAMCMALGCTSFLSFKWKVHKKC